MSTDSNTAMAKGSVGHRALLLLAAGAADTVALAAELDAVKCVSGDDEPKKPVWIQIAKTGTYRGHPSGPFTFSTGTFNQIVRNFQGLLNKRVRIDFEHASEEPPSEGDIAVHGAPACGWVLGLDNRGDELWALVEWCEPARSYIKGNRYKYISPAVNPNAKDRVTGQPIGAYLSSVALTNNPFLDGMAPVTATARKLDMDGGDGGDEVTPSEGTKATAGTLMSGHEFMPKLRQCLGMPPLASPEDCKAMCDRLHEMCLSAGGNVNAVVHGVRLSDHIGPMREMLNLPLTMSPGDLLAQVKTMIDAAIAQHEAEFHGVTKSTNGAGSIALSGKGEATMGLAEDYAALQAKFGTLTAEAADLKLEKKDLEASVTKLTGERDGAVKKLTDVETSAKRDRVEQAFADYREERKLTDEDKESMSLLLSHNPTAFEKRYPRRAADPLKLTQRIVPPAGAGNSAPPKGEAMHSQDDGYGEVLKCSFTELADKIQTRERCTTEEANSRASQLRNAARVAKARA